MKTGAGLGTDMVSTRGEVRQTNAELELELAGWKGIYRALQASQLGGFWYAEVEKMLLCFSDYKSNSG